jgi:beta-galactosidase
MEWLADDGKHINAHACGILFEEGVYYWFGECRNGIGIACYTSTDLYNWKNEGLVFKPDGSVSSDIQKGCIMERPKVVKCENTGKYVLWFHLELAGQGYNAARVATCVADEITGPYEFVRGFRPNDNMSRDQTVFVDDDGIGYHFYSSRDNYDMRLHTMTDDFLNATEEDEMIFTKGAHREAPAIFKHNNTYYLITSGCTGWDPNAARFDVTNDIWQQPWEAKGNPCKGPDANLTFNGQSTFVLKVQGYKDAYIFIADIWRKNDLPSSRYIWLPITIKSDGDIEIQWRDSWKLEEVFGPKASLSTLEDFTVQHAVSVIQSNMQPIKIILNGKLVFGNRTSSFLPMIIRKDGRQRVAQLHKAIINR